MKTFKKLFSHVLLITLALSLAGACAKKKEEEASKDDDKDKKSTKSSSSDDDEDEEEALTADDLVGTYDIEDNCIDAPASLGSAYSGYSIYYMLYVLEDGTMSIAGSVYNASGCQWGAGSTVYQFEQRGSIEVTGLSSSVDHGSKLKFTLTHSEITPRNATWVNKFNTNCSFTAVLNSTVDVSGDICSGPTIASHGWSANGAKMYNVVVKDGDDIEIKLDTSDPYAVFALGSSESYPTSVNRTFIKRDE